MKYDKFQLNSNNFFFSNIRHRAKGPLRKLENSVFEPKENKRSSGFGNVAFRSLPGSSSTTTLFKTTNFIRTNID